MPHADICSLEYAKNIKQCGWGSVRLIAELDTMIELLNCDCMEYMATVPDITTKAIRLSRVDVVFPFSRVRVL